VDPHLRTLIDLQALDTRIVALETEAARIPKQIASMQAGLLEMRKSLDALKARFDAARKDLRAKEKDLDVVAAKRAKAESRLYEVKTNKEYSAVLVEIEDIKQEKSRTEEEILALMELQERLSADIRDAESRHKTREEQGRQDQAVAGQRLAAVEADLAVVRDERGRLAHDLPKGLLGDYERVLKARAGLAIAPVTAAGVCGGCRVAIRPQAIQEARSGELLTHCESCGRFLYWQE
jgi:predicted  nucleic acid-binding Zn-ribbon protein